MAMVCAHPGCCAEISPGSKTGVCRSHCHQSGCRCRQCAGRAAGKDFWDCHDRTVIKTRAQMVAEVLLPEAPMFGYAGPRLILLR